MKKTVAILLAFLLTALCACGKDTPASQNSGFLPKGNGLRITAMGDSIAAGYGLDSQQDNYLSIFASNINATLKNDAVSGYDSDDLLGLLSDGSINNDVSDADMVIISIGGNDILHNYNLFVNTIKSAYPLGEYFTQDVNEIYARFDSNLNQILRIVKEKNPSAAIIVQTLYNPALRQGYKVSVIDAGKIIDKYITQLNNIIVSVCSGYDNVFVFDVADEMNKDADNFYNLKTNFDIHPTKKGHQTLSELFTQYYNKY